MATIIEIQSDKVDKMNEYAEHILRYGGKLMQCLEDMNGGEYKERYGWDSYDERRGRRRYNMEDDRRSRYY